jgi:hypothetical protein
MRRRGAHDAKGPTGNNKERLNAGGTASTEATTSRGYGSLDSNIDLDGVLSTMGQDIDFIFRELSALEDSNPAAVTSSPTRRNKSTDMQKLPTSEGGMRAMNESNLGSTAKIKYTLGSVARTLRTDEGDIKMNGKMNGVSNSGSKPNEPSDPLLIDEDGFIISEDKSLNEDLFAANKRTKEPFQQKDAFQSSFFPQPSPNRHDRKTGNRVARRDTMMTAPVARPETAKSGGAAERRRASMAHAPVTSQARPPQVIDPANKESRIDAVELATKKRIEMLRKLVQERSARFGADDPSLRKGEDALNNKLDFVEEETMKQIARLRTRMGESQRGGLGAQA